MEYSTLCSNFFLPSHQQERTDVSLWLLGVSVNVLSLYNLPLSSSFTASLSQCSASELPDCFIEDAIMKLKQKPWKRSRISCLLSSSHNPALGSHQLCTSWYSEELHENPFTSPTEIFRRATWKSIQLTSQKSNLHKVNRCLARYSPRATTTNRPTTGHWISLHGLAQIDKNSSFGPNLVVLKQ